jgi:peroxiredoxin
MSKKNLWGLMKGALLVISVSLITSGLLGWTDKKPLLKNGVWKAELQRTDGRHIVFNFETKDSAGKKVLYVINGEERLLVDSIAVLNDSVLIHMPFFDSHFRARLDEGGNLEGVWIKRSGDKQQSMPFKARYNQKQRFASAAKPKYTISGRWAVQFTGSNGKTRAAVGEFEQRGGRLTGTFLTTSGDYRYLEGVVAGDSLKLSAFDGSHAFLFTAKVANDSTLLFGRFYSGATGDEQWVARKDEKVSLPDGYDESHMRPGESKLKQFRFRSIDGKEVSLADDTYKNKVVVLQLMGSWCPNCMDETRFLSTYYNSNKDRGVEVVGLAYERTTDYETSKTSLQRFQRRFNVQYPLLVTGVTVSDPFRVEKTLPQLDRIAAFPTTIFIDKKGVVRKIHSGFNGPGTGVHYEQFQKEFNETIETLLSEQ